MKKRDAEAQRIVDGVGIRSLEARDGKIHLTLQGAREVAAVWCQTARTMLADAPNYAETAVEFGDTPGERFAFTIQRVGKLTPHEARQEAEAKATELQQHMDADHKVLIELGVLAAAYKRVAADAISGLEHISMDTDEDRDLHARLIAGFKAALDTANEQQRALAGRIRVDNPGAEPDIAQTVCPVRFSAWNDVRALPRGSPESKSVGSAPFVCAGEYPGIARNLSSMCARSSSALNGRRVDQPITSAPEVRESYVREPCWREINALRSAAPFGARFLGRARAGQLSPR
ncbi:MAG TPA: hypothetical protein VLM11_04800 [Streptosporangiaceae bacterium]|nr:hypothetical protein [Streptosporangiaceae bacterium]